MVRYFFIARIIAASLVLVLWSAFVVFNMLAFFPKIKEGISADLTAMSTETKQVAFGKVYVDTVKQYTTENLVLRAEFLNAYGFLQKLLDKNEENNFEVVKDEQGFGHQMFFGNRGTLDPEIVPRIVRLQQAAVSKNTKLVSIIPLERSIDGYTSFARGLPNGYFNERGDLYAMGLKQNGISCLDLRAKVRDSGLNPAKLFFVTDQHWRVETAFWAYDELASYLNQEFKFQVKSLYLDKDNYNFFSYKNYLGSIGRKTGRYYLGMDDFTLVYPKFATDYQFMADYGNGRTFITHGRFEDSLIASYPFSAATDPFDPAKDKYSAYLHGNYRLGHIINNNNPAGPKVLFIKDSMAPPVIAFFAGLCSEVWLVDLRYYPEGLEDFIAGKELDYIFIMLSLPSVTAEAVPFYKADLPGT